MKLLIITQKVDREDSVLGFFHRWIEEFSKHAESVIVICLYKGVYSLPPNVKVLSLGKEVRESRIQYVTRFYSYIWKERKNYDSVFVHMNQVYVLLGSALWKLMKKKVSLWYVHRQTSLSLFFAEKLSNHIFSSTPEAFKIKSEKVSFVGHGIDTGQFSCQFRESCEILKIIHVGRITKIKNCDVLIDAVSILRGEYNRNVELKFIGGPISAEDFRYKDFLVEKITTLRLQNAVQFAGLVTSTNMSTYYCGADALVNLSPTGGADKVVLEAFCSSRPAFFSNTAFERMLGENRSLPFLFPLRDSRALAQKIDHHFKEEKRQDLLLEASLFVKSEYDISVLVRKIIFTCK